MPLKCGARCEVVRGRRAAIVLLEVSGDDVDEAWRSVTMLQQDNAAPLPKQRVEAAYRDAASGRIVSTPCACPATARLNSCRLRVKFILFKTE